MLEHKPAWWRLYLLVPGMFGLMAVEQFRPMTGLTHLFFDAAVMVLTFGAMLGWVYLNQAHMETDDHRSSSRARLFKITVYEPRTSTRPVESSTNNSPPVAPARALSHLHARQMPVRSGSDQRFLN